MIAIIDSNSGNIASVAKVFKKIGADVVVTHNIDDVRRASHIVLPGVGSFGDGSKRLERGGLIPALNEQVIERKVPFLGICLGMQLLADRGHEFGDFPGLGWIHGTVEKLSDDDVRLPHIGWNDITVRNSAVLFNDVTDPNFYFVHSYHLIPSDTQVIAATCTYGQEFVASIQKDNVFGTQFHPEKSQISGLQVIRNFLNYAQG